MTNKIKLSAFLAALCLVPTISAKNMFADVQVSDIETGAQSSWIRKNQHTPRYPLALAQSGITGCAVFSVNVTESGESDEIKLVAASTKTKLPREAKKLVKKMRWMAASKDSARQAETKKVRLDFCITGNSQQAVIQACKKQSQQLCGEA